MRLSRFAGLMVSALVLLAACHDDSGDASAAGGGQPPPGPAGCGQPGPQVGQWLPAFDSSFETEAGIQQLENPCLPLADLAGVVSDVFPEREDRETRAKFLSELGRMADRFLTAVDLVECGYETDRLAVGVYQHQSHPWSVGVVVVVRGNVGLVEDVALCYLGGLLGMGFDAPSDEEVPLEPQFCALSGAPDGYALVALGSSTWMCRALPRAAPGLTDQVVL
jgi:hypothetical protein